MKAKRRRLVAVAAAFSTVAVLSGGPAYAAGGGGASPCSIAGDPATDPNPGFAINSHLPFGGNGNDGSNPGFNFNGFSGFCRP